MSDRFAFRVWDKEEKRYVAHHGLRDTYNLSLYHFENPDRYEIEEWTGMIDCEGNKIFEGDIIKGGGDFGKGKVVWNNTLSCYEFVDVDAREIFYENKKRELFVIGNVKERNDSLSKENKRLKDALENIKEKAELTKSEASNATYGFACEIEELAREAIKGGKE